MKKACAGLSCSYGFPLVCPRSSQASVPFCSVAVISRSYVYGWTCTTVFLISFRKLPHFLSKASTFSPVIRISSVFLFTIYSRVRLDSIDFYCFPSLSKVLKVFFGAFFKLFGREQCPPIDQLSGFSFVKSWLFHLELVNFFIVTCSTLMHSTGEHWG